MPRSSKLFEMAAYLLRRPNRNSDASGFEVLGTVLAIRIYPRALLSPGQTA